MILLDNVTFLCFLKSPQTDGVIRVVKVLIGIDSLPLHASLKMQMLRCGASCTSSQGNQLSGLDVIANLDQILRIVAIICFQPIRMFDANQVAISVIIAGEYHLPVESRIDIIIGFGLDIRS